MEIRPEVGQEMSKSKLSQETKVKEYTLSFNWMDEVCISRCNIKSKENASKIVIWS